MIGALVLVGLCGVGFWWLQSKMTEKLGFMVGYAMGDPGEETIQMHVIVSMPMVNTEGRRRTKDGRLTTWEEWIEEHFDLRDDAGRKVPLAREAWSSLISQQQASNPEFFMRAELRKGVNYIFDYIPIRDDWFRYRHNFTAPADSQPLVRATFEPAEILPVERSADPAAIVRALPSATVVSRSSSQFSVFSFQGRSGRAWQRPEFRGRLRRPEPGP